MEEMMEELAQYYQAMGFVMYSEEHLKEMSEEEIRNLYELTFPNR